MTLPLFIRKFAIDAIETAIAMLLAVEIALPTSVEEAQKAAIVLGTAILAAIVSAARRATPGFLAWLREKLGVAAE